MENFCEKQTGYVFNNSQWENFITAPTHQMAIKWLREIHKILISFNASFVNSIEQHFSWKIRINSLKSLNDEKHFEPIYIHVKSESSEEAATSSDVAERLLILSVIWLFASTDCSTQRETSLA